jgi:hypothetical protein
MRPPLDGKPLYEDEKRLGNILVDDGHGIPPVSRDEIRLADSDVRAENQDDDMERRLRRLSRRGFTLGGVTVLAGFLGWRWLVTRSEKDGLPWPLRRALELDERLARGLFHRPAGDSRSLDRLARVNRDG